MKDAVLWELILKSYKMMVLLNFQLSKNEIFLTELQPNNASITNNKILMKAHLVTDTRYNIIIQICIIMILKMQLAMFLS